MFGWRLIALTGQSMPAMPCCLAHSEQGVASFGVESGAFFDRYEQEGKMSTAQGKRRMVRSCLLWL